MQLATLSAPAEQSCTCWFYRILLLAVRLESVRRYERFSLRKFPIAYRRQRIHSIMFGACIFGCNAVHPFPFINVIQKCNYRLPRGCWTVLHFTHFVSVMLFQVTLLNSAGFYFRWWRIQFVYFETHFYSTIYSPWTSQICVLLLLLQKREYFNIVLVVIVWYCVACLCGVPSC